MKTAFTLMETVAVLVILAALSAVVAGTVSSPGADRTFPKTLRSRLFLAQSEAMRTGGDVVVSCLSGRCSARSAAGTLSVSGDPFIPVPDGCPGDGFVVCYGPDGTPYSDEGCTVPVDDGSIPSMTCGKTVSVTPVTGFPEES